VQRHKDNNKQNVKKFFSTSINFFLLILNFFPLYFNISNITINIKKCIKKKHFTFHHYWGAFVRGGFCPVPNIYIVKPVLRGPELSPLHIMFLLKSITVHLNVVKYSQTCP
jgi:hypothetical protein